MKTMFAALAAFALAGAASAQFNLAGYQVAASYPLPGAASEASAVAFNHDTGTLFVLGDEGDAVVQVSTVGVLINTMALTGFDDTESLAYVGGGQFVIGEERIQDVYRMTYTAGGLVSRGSLPAVDLGPTVGNIGIEGIAYEPSTNLFFTVKENSPQAVRSGTIDFAGGTNTLADLFNPAGLGVADLSDIALLSSVTALMGTADADSLLLFSQESARLLEVSRTGVVLSMFDFSAFAGTAEGVAVGPDGTIYIVGEDPTLYVLTPIPTPGAAGLLAFAGIAATRRRR